MDADEDGAKNTAETRRPQSSIAATESREAYGVRAAREQVGLLQCREEAMAFSLRASRLCGFSGGSVAALLRLRHLWLSAEWFAFS